MKRASPQAATPEKTFSRSRKASHSGFERLARWKLTSTSSSGWFTGRYFNITASIKLKIAVFAPIPNPSDKITTAANPGLERRVRNA